MTGTGSGLGLPAVAAAFTTWAKRAPQRREEP